MSISTSNTLSSNGSSRVNSASGLRKVGHTSVQHDKFHTPPPSVPTRPLQDPFRVYHTKLEQLDKQLKQGTLASHHLVIDCVRILEDVLLHAGATFLEHPYQPSPQLLTLTVEHSIASINERLRDAEVISPWTNRQIEEARKLSKWVLVSSAREVPLETSTNLFALVNKLVLGFIDDIEHAAANKPKSGCTANHTYCREMLPQHLDVVGGPHNAHTLPPTVRPGLVTSDDGGSASGTASGGNSSSTPDMTRGGLANPPTKVPRPRAHDALPYNWSITEFEEHCVPLHNTTHLDLQALEEEEEEAEREQAAQLESERQEKIRLREEAAERRRQRREAEELERARGRDGVDGDLSDLDENPEEVDSEEERLTARRREAREAARDQTAPDDEVDEEEEDDEDADDEDDDDDVRAEKAARRAEKEARRLQEAEDEKVANEPIPAVAPKPARFAFTFCCIVCHTVLLRAKDIDRIHSNQVWTKTGKNLSKTLLKNHSDSWFSRPADELDLGSASSLNDEDEDEQAAAGGGDEEDDESSTATLFTPPKDEGAAKREESIGVQCAGCDYYLGRYFPMRDAYRLIYIQRSTGTNYMYFTGSISSDRLRPNLKRLSETEEEEEEERRRAEEEELEQGEEEEDADYIARKRAIEERKKNAPIPPVIGLPNEYADPRQAELYPFPRFGSIRPYNRPNMFQILHTTMVDAAQAKKMLEEARRNANANGTGSESSNDQSDAKSPTGNLLSSLKSPANGSGVIAKMNSKTFRPHLGVPSLGAIHTQLRQRADSHYELPPLTDGNAELITADLSTLVWTDRIFHQRRQMDLLTSRVQQLFAHFPSGVYANTNHPVVPLFTYFFVKDAPDFTHCRGTARYLFHFLTKKDDSKLKRLQYTFKKFVKSLTKHENSVFHMTAGGYGGHRFVLVKIGSTFKLFQSNHCLELSKDRYTVLQWIASDYPWSRTLDLGELFAFLAKFEEARRGRRQIWEELFTANQKAQGLYDVSDTWQPDQVFFCQAKLQDGVITV